MAPNTAHRESSRRIRALALDSGIGCVEAGYGCRFRFLSGMVRMSSRVQIRITEEQLSRLKLGFFVAYNT
jgi:hypothetical protein